PLLQTLIHGGYHAFAEAELETRGAAGFPPFAHMALLRAEARDPGAPLAMLQSVRALMDDAVLELSGPVPAPMPRRAGLYRAQLAMASPRRPVLQAVLASVVPSIHALPEARRVR